MAEQKDASEGFTVALGAPPPPPPDNPTLHAPTFALAERPFKVTGMTPESNQHVWIELEVTGWDEKIAEGVSNSENKFEIEVQLTELGYHKIHSEIETLGINKTSRSINVLVFNYLIIGGIVLAVFLVLWRAGVFKKLGGKK